MTGPSRASQQGRLRRSQNNLPQPCQETPSLPRTALLVVIASHHTAKPSQPVRFPGFPTFSARHAQPIRVRPSRIRRLEEIGGLEPNPKPNLLLVATASRLDSLQAKSLEPGPTKHCTRLVYTGRRNKKEDRSARDFFWRKLGASSQPQIQTLCSSGLDRCN